MAYTNGDGAASRAAERVAQHAIFRVVALTMAALSLPVGSWIGTEVWSQLKENNKATTSLERRIDRLDALFSPLQEQQKTLNQNIENNRAVVGSLENRVNAHAQRHDTVDKRLDGLDARNRDQDIEIREMQRRVWRMPDGGPPVNQPPPMVPSAPSLEVYPPPRPR